MITKPTPADLLDRLCVLRLKIVQARTLNEPHQHFLQEQDEVVLGLADYTVKMPLPVSIATDLAQLHERLWRVLDEQKEWVQVWKAQADPSPCMRDPRAVLADLWDLNQERYRLKHELEMRMGEYRGREKL